MEEGKTNLKMAKKILIAEDVQKFKDKYGEWASSLGYEIVEASGVDEAVEMLGQVDAVITDHGLRQGNGNDLAKLAKDHNLPVAGISGGGRDIFDSRYVDIPESKAIGQEGFSTLVECLFENDPRESYGEKTLQNVDLSLLDATNIIFQGYYLAKAIRTGQESINLDGREIIGKEQMDQMRDMCQPNVKDPSSLLDFFSENDIDPNNVLELAYRVNPSLKGDKRLTRIFDKLNQEGRDFTIEDAAYAAEALVYQK